MLKFDDFSIQNDEKIVKKCKLLKLHKGLTFIEICCIVYFMRVECIFNQHDVGWLSVKIQQIPGITVGKQYDVMVYANTVSNCSSDARFFLYNDFKQWEHYDPGYFKPVQEIKND